MSSLLSDAYGAGRAIAALLVGDVVAFTAPPEFRRGSAKGAKRKSCSIGYSCGSTCINVKRVCGGKGSKRATTFADYLKKLKATGKALTSGQAKAAKDAGFDISGVKVRDRDGRSLRSRLKDTAEKRKGEAGGRPARPATTPKSFEDQLKSLGLADDYASRSSRLGPDSISYFQSSAKRMASVLMDGGRAFVGRDGDLFFERDGRWGQSSRYDSARVQNPDQRQVRAAAMADGALIPGSLRKEFERKVQEEERARRDRAAARARAEDERTQEAKSFADALDRIAKAGPKGVEGEVTTAGGRTVGATMYGDIAIYKDRNKWGLAGFLADRESFVPLRESFPSRREAMRSGALLRAYGGLALDDRGRLRGASKDWGGTGGASDTFWQGSRPAPDVIERVRQFADEQSPTPSPRRDRKAKPQPEDAAPRDRGTSNAVPATPANYAKNAFAISNSDLEKSSPDTPSGMMTDRARLLKNLGARYSGRERAYILTPAQLKTFRQYEAAADKPREEQTIEERWMFRPQSDRGRTSSRKPTQEFIDSERRMDANLGRDRAPEAPSRRANNPRLRAIEDDVAAIADAGDRLGLLKVAGTTGEQLFRMADQRDRPMPEDTGDRQSRQDRIIRDLRNRAISSKASDLFDDADIAIKIEDMRDAGDRAGLTNIARYAARHLAANLDPSIKPTAPEGIDRAAKKLIEDVAKLGDTVALDQLIKGPLSSAEATLPRQRVNTEGMDDRQRTIVDNLTPQLVGQVASDRSQGILENLQDMGREGDARSLLQAFEAAIKFS